MKNFLTALALISATTAHAGEFTELSLPQQMDVAMQTMPVVGAYWAVQHHCQNEPEMLSDLITDFLTPMLETFTPAQTEYMEIITPRIQETLTQVPVMGCEEYLNKMRNQ